MRILLVDDDSITRMLLANLFRSIEWEVTEAQSGEQAISVWRPGTVDVILTDIYMAGMDGFEFASQVRAAESAMPNVPPVRLIALSGDIPSGDSSAMARDHGAFDSLLRKPATFEEILKAVEA